jgi:hypothetical protein
VTSPSDANAAAKDTPADPSFHLPVTVGLATGVAAKKPSPVALT